MGDEVQANTLSDIIGTAKIEDTQKVSEVEKIKESFKTQSKEEEVLNIKANALSNIREINTSGYSDVTKAVINSLKETNLIKNPVETEVQIKKEILKGEFLNKVDITKFPVNRQHEANLLTNEDINSLWNYKNEFQARELEKLTLANANIEIGSKEDEMKYIFNNTYGLKIIGVN